MQLSEAAEKYKEGRCVTVYYGDGVIVDKMPLNEALSAFGLTGGDVYALFYTLKKIKSNGVTIRAAYLPEIITYDRAGRSVYQIEVDACGRVIKCKEFRSVTQALKELDLSAIRHAIRKGLARNGAWRNDDLGVWLSYEKPAGV